MEVEKHAEVKFDKIAIGIASKMGYEEIPWFKFTLYLTYIYTVLTILVLTYRPDFFNVSNRVYY